MTTEFKLPKIISFSGRKQSAKSLLSDLCVEYGYILINFADELKLLCCKILDISLEELNKRKEIPYNFKLNHVDMNIISRETGILVEEIHDILDNKQFNSVRELLQVIGTDIIRQYNQDWHVNIIRQKILSSECNTRYVLSDARFFNEKKMVEELGGETFFIIRPQNWSVSNHESEINLRWGDFKKSNILINNSSKENFVDNMRSYLESGVFINMDLHEQNNTYYNDAPFETMNPYLIENLKQWFH